MKTVINSEGFRLVSFDSGKPGLTVCISGGVHGNEICGVKAITKLEEKLLSEENLLSGRVLTLIANQEAIRLKKRFVDFDLNRAFGNLDAIGHEFNLAKKIIPHLQDIDYLLDLHSTSAPTKPFCAGILTRGHLEVFKMTGIDIYTHGWELHRGYSMLIDEVNRAGGMGIIAECGETDDEITNYIAYQTAINLLENLHLFSTSEFKLNTKNYTIIKIKNIVKAKSDNFSFVRDFKNLEQVNTNELIAYDEQESISYNYQFLISMPTIGSLQIGDEAFGIGIKEKLRI
jgi:uncharacterized protein